MIIIFSDSRFFGHVFEMEDEIQRLRATRQILKEEIFRLEKNYKPTKPTPRKYRSKKPKSGGIA